MKLDLFINRVNRSNLSIEKQCKIKHYLKTDDKFAFLKEFKQKFNELKGNYEGFESYLGFIIFNLLVIKYYTDIELDITVEEFDILQENNFIDKIVEYIGNDYSLLLRFTQLDGE